MVAYHFYKKYILYVIRFKIVGRKTLVCITVDELSTFLKPSSNLTNLKMTLEKSKAHQQ